MAMGAKTRRLNPNARQLVLLVARLAVEYFQDSGRDFPWRTERNPYRLAIAEILLQKTRASAVVPVYLALIARYPGPASLSEGSSNDLEAMLHPLGLSLKRAEQLIGMGSAVNELGEAIFDDVRTLIAAVPGIGAYGARAIACFGRGEQVGIVDANVARIFRRVFKVRSKDPRAAIYQRYADEVSQASSDPRATNFGLLDIGAKVCLSKPLCDRCPFSGFCPRYGLKSKQTAAL